MDRRHPRNRRKNSNRNWTKPKKVNIGLEDKHPYEERQPRTIPEGCICLRAKGVVLCKVCGYTVRGRVRRECPVHAQTIYLMDLERCPNCHGNSEILKEYQIE